MPDPMELEHHIPVYIPKLVYPEYRVPSDDDIQIEDQTYAADASPSALSPGYISESDPEKDLKEDSEEDPIDYAADTDDDDKEEKEHLAPNVALLAVDPVPSTKETEPFETDEYVATPPPPPAYRTTFPMYVRTQTPIPFPSEEEELIDQGVANALTARNADRSRNGEDNHDSGTGVRRQAPLAHECTYPDFMKCKPLYFKGTEGVIELTQWFERMEIVFRIRNCAMEKQIKFATCSLLGSSLTWWNSHVRTVGHAVVYVMTWTNLKKKMTDKYCPRGEIKKLEVEMMFLEESDKIEKYVGGLSDMIHRSVKASKPRTMHDAIEFETELMDKKISTFDEH
ncbi:reverse transcriptase domain-containing protein [Tanacetum coccineum]